MDKEVSLRQEQLNLGTGCSRAWLSPFRCHKVNRWEICAKGYGLKSAKKKINVAILLYCYVYVLLFFIYKRG